MDPGRAEQLIDRWIGLERFEPDIEGGAIGARRREPALVLADLVPEPEHSTVVPRDPEDREKGHDILALAGSALYRVTASRETPVSIVSRVPTDQAWAIVGEQIKHSQRRPSRGRDLTMTKLSPARWP